MSKQILSTSATTKLKEDQNALERLRKQREKLKNTAVKTILQTQVERKSTRPNNARPANIKTLGTIADDEQEVRKALKNILERRDLDVNILAKRTFVSDMRKQDKNTVYTEDDWNKLPVEKKVKYILKVMAASKNGGYHRKRIMENLMNLSQNLRDMFIRDYIKPGQAKDYPDYYKYWITKPEVVLAVRDYVAERDKNIVVKNDSMLYTRFLDIKQNIFNNVLKYADDNKIDLPKGLLRKMSSGSSADKPKDLPYDVAMVENKEELVEALKTISDNKIELDTDIDTDKYEDKKQEKRIADLNTAASILKKINEDEEDEEDEKKGGKGSKKKTALGKLRTKTAETQLSWDLKSGISGYNQAINIIAKEIAGRNEKSVRSAIKSVKKEVLSEYILLANAICPYKATTDNDIEPEKTKYFLSLPLAVFISKIVRAEAYLLLKCDTIKVATVFNENASTLQKKYKTTPDVARMLELKYYCYSSTKKSLLLEEFEGGYEDEQGNFIPKKVIRKRDPVTGRLIGGKLPVIYEKDRSQIKATKYVEPTARYKTNKDGTRGEPMYSEEKQEKQERETQAPIHRDKFVEDRWTKTVKEYMKYQPGITKQKIKERKISLQKLQSEIDKVKNLITSRSNEYLKKFIEKNSEKLPGLVELARSVLKERNEALYKRKRIDVFCVNQYLEFKWIPHKVHDVWIGGPDASDYTIKNGGTLTLNEPVEGYDTFHKAGVNFFSLQCKDTRREQKGNFFTATTASGKTVNLIIAFDITVVKDSSASNNLPDAIDCYITPIDKEDGYSGIVLIQNENIFLSQLETEINIKNNQQMQIEILLNSKLTDTAKKVAKSYFMKSLDNIIPNSENDEYYVAFANKAVEHMRLKENSSARDLFQKVANVLAYMNLSSAKIFRERIKQRYYLPENFFELSPSDMLPEVFEIYDMYNPDDKKVKFMADYLHAKIADILYDMGISYYRNLNPTARVNRPPMQEEDIIDVNIVYDDICENNKGNSIPKDNIVYYHDMSRNKIYCFDVNKLAERFHKGKFTNKYTKDEFSENFINSYTITYTDIPDSLSDPAGLKRTKPEKYTFPFRQIYNQIQEGKYNIPGTDKVFSKQFCDKIAKFNTFEDAAKDRVTRFQKFDLRLSKCVNRDSVYGQPIENIVIYTDSNGVKYCFAIDNLIKLVQNSDNKDRIQIPGYEDQTFSRQFINSFSKKYALDRYVPPTIAKEKKEEKEMLELAAERPDLIIIPELGKYVRDFIAELKGEVVTSEPPQEEFVEEVEDVDEVDSPTSEPPQEDEEDIGQIEEITSEPPQEEKEEKTSIIEEVLSEEEKPVSIGSIGSIGNIESIKSVGSVAETPASKESKGSEVGEIVAVTSDESKKSQGSTESAKESKESNESSKESGAIETIVSGGMSFGKKVKCQFCEKDTDKGIKSISYVSGKPTIVYFCCTKCIEKFDFKFPDDLKKKKK